MPRHGTCSQHPHPGSTHIQVASAKSRPEHKVHCARTPTQPKETDHKQAPSPHSNITLQSKGTQSEGEAHMQWGHGCGESCSVPEIDKGDVFHWGVQCTADVQQHLDVAGGDVLVLLGRGPRAVVPKVQQLRGGVVIPLTKQATPPQSTTIAPATTQMHCQVKREEAQKRLILRIRSCAPTSAGASSSSMTFST